MMAKPALSDAAIAAERPVVLAEQREQPGPQVRFGDALRATFFAGQPLAERSPIGTVKTLEAATAASVKAFHDRWYRPERAVVIIAGDMDPARVRAADRQELRRLEGRWAPNPADPDFGKPDPQEAGVRRAWSSPGCRRSPRWRWCGRGRSTTTPCCSTRSGWSTRSRRG